MMNSYDPVALTGLTREEVLEGIRRGDIHPNSRAVAIHGINPQEIAFIMPQPGFMVGALKKPPSEILQELKQS